MDSKWTQKWKEALIWFVAYANVIAFALVGGYVIVKNEDEELKKTTKFAFVVTLAFTAISAFFSLFYNFGSFADSFYGSDAYEFYSVANTVVSILKILVFAGLIVYTLFFKHKDGDKTEGAPAEE